jgi:hypothetical protein
MPEDGGAAQPQPKRYKLVSPPPQEQAPNTTGKADRAMRFAKNTDAKQQTTRKLRTMGRNSIIEARRR